MRVNREEAARSREKIVGVAGRQFRKLGYDGVGIADLMKAAGRTHGGFYKLFDDKEALMVEATARALLDNRENWAEVMAKAPGDPVAALRRWYLSHAHRDHPAHGCAYAALAAEAPRHSGALGTVFEEGLDASIAQISRELPDGEDREGAIRVIAQLIGTLILARAVRSPSLATEILQTACDGQFPSETREEDRQ